MDFKIVGLLVGFILCLSAFVGLSAVRIYEQKIGENDYAYSTGSANLTVKTVAAKKAKPPVDIPEE